ncbi:hypothetical protein M0R72_05275 [Candidatus Pacearchaeota archaeon]|jgi:hypothetical protein|nr:hypothetical protein [Candidatus Pacearchaeota archaeon]
MIKDSRGVELSQEVIYQIGENSASYEFEKYVDISKSSALFSSKEPLTNGEPNEIVLSQEGINLIGVYSKPISKDKTSGLESTVSQSLPKCTIEKS